MEISNSLIFCVEKITLYLLNIPLKKLTLTSFINCSAIQLKILENYLENQH